MVGSIVWIGPGFAKIRTGNQFVSLWKVFVYVILEAIAWAVLEGPISEGIEMLLRVALIYISGITTAMIGTFFWWLVRAFDYKITRDFRWLVPGICYAITLFNLWSYNFAQPGFSSSDIQLISAMLVVGFLIVMAYVVWRAFGGRGRRIGEHRL
jgi:hypothetical protein